MFFLGTRGLLVPSALCAALVLGPVGTAAATEGSPRGASDTVAAQPTAFDLEAATTAWTRDLDRRLVALEHTADTTAADSLLDVMTDLRERGDAPLSKAEAAEYTDRVETAYGQLRDRPTSSNKREGDEEESDEDRAADPTSDATAQLQKSVTDLLAGLTSLDLGKTLGAVTSAVPAVLSLLTGVLGSATSAVPAAPAA
ncbi:hypothetical protein [Streptomyces sp. NPDC087294]|uniref:hypothetical protein n=1 Tax=Streptomyces sp. NPDC087294 TaxID=3365777 RepID=UPI00381F8741